MREERTLTKALFLQGSGLLTGLTAKWIPTPAIAHQNVPRHGWNPWERAGAHGSQQAEAGVRRPPTTGLGQQHLLAASLGSIQGPWTGGVGRESGLWSASRGSGRLKHKTLDEAIGIGRAVFSGAATVVSKDPARIKRLQKDCKPSRLRLPSLSASIVLRFIRPPDRRHAGATLPTVRFSLCLCLCCTVLYGGPAPWSPLQHRLHRFRSLAVTLQLASLALSLESRVRLCHSSPPEDSAPAGKSGPSGFARTVLGQRNNNTLVARARVHTAQYRSWRGVPS